MITLIEDYLVVMMQDGLDYLKNNIDRIDKIINTPTPRPDRLKEFLLKTPIKIVKGYPRTVAELPCICVLLSSEEESQETLGDYDNDEDWSILTKTETVTVSATPDGQISIPYFITDSKALVSVSKIVDSDGEEIASNYYEIMDASKGLVGLYVSATDGEELQVTFSYREVSMDMVQVLYESNYRLEVWAPNADLVVDLYHIVKWAFLFNRDKLVVDRGLFRQKLGGADYEPAPSFFPDFVYRRGFTFWCQYSVSIPTEEVPYISGVDINETIVFDNK